MNNDFYDDLNEGWYHAFDHPIALLRAENAIRAPWILSHLQQNQKILDIGCGAGFLANELAQKGHHVFGIDLSLQSLEIAKKYDKTQRVEYKYANAYCLPFENQSFDVVCALDVLEHVHEPQLLIAEASRVLKPGGLFFFHTFNRNILSYLLVIKLVEWIVPNTPKDIHVYSMFIKPKEFADMCYLYDFKIKCIQGLVPQFSLNQFIELFRTQKVPPSFKFSFSKSLLTGYCGFAEKGVYP